MAFSFLPIRSLAGAARQLTLARYSPVIALEGLSTGIDNLRTDVYLSHKFADTTRHQIAKLIAKYGGIEDFLMLEQTFSPPPRNRFVGPRPSRGSPGALAKANEPAEFKKVLLDLHVAALNRAKAENNIVLDLLARLAIIKLQRAEMQSQFSQVTERCRAKLKSVDSVRTANPAIAMQERFARFQIGKKSVLRKVGQDFFATLRELEKESLANMRRALFGDTAAGSYDLFLNRLLFTEDGRDDLLNAEQYVMLGNFGSDPDRFQRMRDIACSFLKSLKLAHPDGDEEKDLDAVLNAPENAQELVAGGTPDESTAKGKSQKALLAAWLETLEQEDVMERVIAAYEVVPLLPHYFPPINPQQLKNALVFKDERKRVQTLLEEHGLSTDSLHAALNKVQTCKGNDRSKVAGRFLGDFMRYHRDLRRLEALISAMDNVNVIGTEKMRELSAINNTLYEYPLPEEQRAAEDKITHHVILKADIRDSTTLTRTLFERGLNPASYFSLNFYDPVNKLLAKYGAVKVFIEGDAVIFALFEREGEQGFGVARTCVFAKEIIEIVQGYNAKSKDAGLPTLELGIGISYQDTAPMYLMDGDNRIMISKALNESDRLSSCTKGARKFVDMGETLFNVYAFQTVAEADIGALPEEFLVRYNIGGIHMSPQAFEKLEHEIVLAKHNAALPSAWDGQAVRLYSGVVPVDAGLFHKIVVREATIPFVNGADLSLKNWTEHRYYEVCTHPAIYEFVDQQRSNVASVS